MGKIRLVVIDDNDNKIQYVEEGAKKLGVEVVAFRELVPAIEFLQRKRVDGIVTDMEYPVYPNNPESFQKNAGELLLKWLVHEEQKIPVLMNSTAILNFKTEYAYYKGAMPGYFRPDLFYNFVASIKDHD